jgi:hypothetical protein
MRPQPVEKLLLDRRVGVKRLHRVVHPFALLLKRMRSAETTMAAALE